MGHIKMMTDSASFCSSNDFTPSVNRIQCPDVEESIFPWAQKIINSLPNSLRNEVNQKDKKKTSRGFTKKRAPPKVEERKFRRNSILKRQSSSLLMQKEKKSDIARSFSMVGNRSRKSLRVSTSSKSYAK